MLKKYIKNFLKDKIKSIYKNRIGSFFFKQKGYCTCCEQEVNFVVHNSWLRDHFICSNCNSKPRERVLMLTITRKYPNWKVLKIHESSPGNRGHSVNLKKHAEIYIETQFYVNYGICIDHFYVSLLSDQICSIINNFSLSKKFSNKSFVLSNFFSWEMNLE